MYGVGLPRGARTRGIDILILFGECCDFKVCYVAVSSRYMSAWLSI